MIQTSKISKIKEINIDFAESVAYAFNEMEHSPGSMETFLAYSQLIAETIDQYKIVLDLGLKVEYYPPDIISPYLNPHQAIKDIRENNHLYILPTRGSFGSDKNFDPIDNPLLKETSFIISGEKALANDLFRVIHDYFGHYKGDNGFRSLGEENAYRYHCSMFSPLAIQALTTETRGQNSWLNFGPYGEHNRSASETETIFADQKIGILPPFTRELY